jgi:hypothetical protein
MKKQNITLSLALAAVFSSSVAFAEAEVTGKIVHESAAFIESGLGIGAATTSTQTADSHGQDLFKMATHAKVFVDGDVSEDVTYHVELNAFKDLDSDTIGDYDSNESYTQRDLLREAYIDTETNGISIRAGKQQVVWGTADGMKLLDAINPTDYSEMAQNQMEDSRIPVWMLNTETDVAGGGNWQFIVSESKSSIFAGLGEASAKGSSHTNGNKGHAFTMKGADTITGTVNGFLNVAPALGTVATAFDAMAYSGGAYVTLSPFATATVDDFVSTSVQNTGFEGICTGSVSDASCLAAVAHDATVPVSGAAGANNQQVQNLIDAYGDDTKWDASNPNSMFEYLGSTTFKTFDSFVGMTSQYKVDHDSTPVLSSRYKNSTQDGLNYSFNVTHGNDTNPYVDMHWENDLGVKLHEIQSGTSMILGDSTSDTVTEVGGTSNTAAAGATRTANLVMTEKLNKITQIGGSFDTAIETATLGPVVLRGEALYQKNVMSPVVTRKDTSNIDMAHGFLTSSVKMLKGDRFKYVLGADITALTNMMVSFQFIQDRNLDYVDIGNKDATNWKYTADMATMHLTNNLHQAEENKEFYSFFLSKPFGASGEHRWNNIVMFEENGGLWNRLDAEYSIDDNTQATIELNKYWGDINTQFGQLAKSSNIQVGFKYSF